MDLRAPAIRCAWVTPVLETNDVNLSCSGQHETMREMRDRGGETASGGGERSCEQRGDTQAFLHADTLQALLPLASTDGQFTARLNKHQPADLPRGSGAFLSGVPAIQLIRVDVTPAISAS